MWQTHRVVNKQCDSIYRNDINGNLTFFNSHNHAMSIAVFPLEKKIPCLGSWNLSFSYASTYDSTYDSTYSYDWLRRQVCNPVNGHEVFHCSSARETIDLLWNQGKISLCMPGKVARFWFLSNTYVRSTFSNVKKLLLQKSTFFSRSTDLVPISMDIKPLE